MLAVRMSSFGRSQRASRLEEARSEAITKASLGRRQERSRQLRLLHDSARDLEAWKWGYLSLQASGPCHGEREICRTSGWKSAPTSTLGSYRGPGR